MDESQARITRRAALAGSLSALVAASCGGGVPSGGAAAGRRGIQGGFVDDGVEPGHLFRDGGLSGLRAGKEKRARVVIVGGGVAGLGAAWRLARAGVKDVVLLELAPAPGGTSRAGSMALDGGGRLPCPFGAHYLPRPRLEQRAIAAFLADIGIADGVDSEGLVRVADRLLVRDPAERVAGLGGYFEEGLWLRAGAGAKDEEELRRFEEITESMIAVDADGRRRFDLPLERSSAAGRELDQINAADWAASQGLDGERIRWYLEYATRDDFGASLGDTSAWALMHYFTSRASLLTKESASFLTWPEGNGRLVAGLLEASGVRVETGEVCLGVEPGPRGSQLTSANPGNGVITRWSADAVILATPQYVTRRLLKEDPARDARASMRYSPWVVANLHLSERPTNRGFPYAWDSVIHGSKSLGYVDASHQLDRGGARDTVWSWYLPITDSDEGAVRAKLLAMGWEEWRDAVLADLRRAHPNIDDVATRIDVWRWGHGMIKPTPGLLWGGARAEAAQPIGRLYFAHSDLSGMALFEEAHWQGTRAAEEVLRDALGIQDESLL